MTQAEKDLETRRKGGRARWANVPPEKRSEIMSRNGKNRWMKTKKSDVLFVKEKG